MTDKLSILTRERNPLIRAGIIPPDSFEGTTPYASEMAGQNRYDGKASTFDSIAQNSGGRAAQMLGQIAGQPMTIEDKSRDDLNRIVNDNIVAETRTAARQIYGQNEATKPTRRRKLGERAKRLSPIGPISGGSPAQPGNPYSIDTRGLIGGLASLAVGLINKERNERVYGENGFVGELMDLQSAEERNLRRDEQVTDFVGKEVPRRIAAKETEDRMLAVKRQDLTNAMARITAQGESWGDRDRARAQAQSDLEELRQSGRMGLAEYNAEQRRLLEADRFNRIERSAQTRAGAGATTQLMQTIRQPLSSINKSITDIEEQLALNPDNAELKKSLDGLRSREEEIVKAQISVMVERAGMNIDEANLILDDLGYTGLKRAGVRTTTPPPSGNNAPAQGGNAGGGTGPVRAQEYPGWVKPK